MQLVIDEKVLSVQTTMGEGIMIMMITQLQDQLRSDILETGKKKKWKSIGIETFLCWNLRKIFSFLYLFYSKDYCFDCIVVLDLLEENTEHYLSYGIILIYLEMFSVLYFTYLRKHKDK